MAMAKDRSWFLVAFLISVATAGVNSSDDQCDASGSCSGTRGPGIARYETFEDIPDEMVQRGHMKELGSHRDPDSEVEVLPYMISSEDFYENYVVRHKPVVIKNVAKHWRAGKLWTDEYLKENFGKIKLNMETRDDDKWRIPPSRLFGKFLDDYKEADLYLVDEMPPAMRKDINMPLCLRCDEIGKRFFVSYFWMSNGDTSSKLHIDTDENFLTVINGYKDLVLISPKYSRDVYADEARMLGVSEVNVSAVDLHTFPRIANVRYMTAHLKAGDGLYLPQMWWHYVYSGPVRQQSVAMWWKSIPYQKGFAVKSVSTSRERTPEERAAENRNTSLARWLEEYIYWIDDLRPDLDARPACENQIQLMSDFQFETDKEEWRDELTDGEATTENPNADMDRFGSACYFDSKNPESPCWQRVCSGFTPGEKEVEEDEVMHEDDKDDEEMESLCIRYILDYCDKFEDRGCVIELPQYLNKKSDDAVVHLAKMRNRLTKDHKQN